MLFWFRRGWTMRSGATVVAAALGSGADTTRADGLAGWFLTPDQQGRIAFGEKRFGEAVDLFSDPLWKGHTLYRAGRYEEAAEASDTGEQTGIGADDVIFDNEEARGAETTIDTELGKEAGLESAEMWMRSVDTDTADFLRSRFLLESSRSAKRSGFRPYWPSRWCRERRAAIPASEACPGWNAKPSTASAGWTVTAIS